MCHTSLFPKSQCQPLDRDVRSACRMSCEFPRCRAQQTQSILRKRYPTWLSLGFRIVSFETEVPSPKNSKRWQSIRTPYYVRSCTSDGNLVIFAYDLLRTTPYEVLLSCQLDCFLVSFPAREDNWGAKTYSVRIPYLVW